MRRTVTTALLLMPLLLAGTARDGGAEPTVGEAYPPLRLPTIDGSTFDLRTLRGRKVLLIEFASW